MPNAESKQLQDDVNIQALHELLIDQQEDLQQLCTLVESLAKSKDGPLDSIDVQKYEGKVNIIIQNQEDRFNNIDALMNKNIIAVKKGKTTDKTALIFGKEVRKLEAGLRTLKLFVQDIIEMLDPKSDMINRVNERLYYFHKRSVTLEDEIKLLQGKLAKL